MPLKKKHIKEEKSSEELQEPEEMLGSTYLDKLIPGVLVDPEQLEGGV